MGFSLLGPTLEVRFFNRWGHSIDISIPVTNIVIVSVVNEGFFWITSAYYNFNIGSGSVRFLLGPGLGFSVGAWSGLTAGGIRLPAVLGVEFNTRARGFGFQLMTRPWVDFAFGEVSQGVGGGAMLELGFIWYATR